MEEVSKIILKEKAKQEELLSNASAGIKAYDKVYFEQHKNFLINLKEYIEERLLKITDICDRFPFVKMEESEALWNIKNWYLLGEKNQLRFDLLELTKMIGMY